MDFQVELHAALGVDVENGIETVGKELEAVVDHLRRHRREGIQQMPDAGAGEAVNHADAELLGGSGGMLQFLGGQLVEAVRL